jgi:histidinol-phosphatase (PHP family)
MTRYPPDYHTHTELCQHAVGMPADYAEMAGRKGILEIACTDHAPAPGEYDPEHRMVSPQFEIYREGVLQAQQAGKCRVLFGVEADYYDGCEAHLERWISKQEFDLVLGSVHTGKFWEIDVSTGRSDYSGSYIQEVWRLYFGQLQKLARTGFYDIIAHFDLPKRGGIHLQGDSLREVALPTLDAVAKAGMAIEINTSGLHHPAQEAYPSPQILAWARERDIPITFGSDAHSPDRVGNDFETAIRIAREAGYTQSARYQRRQRTLESF